MALNFLWRRWVCVCVTPLSSIVWEDEGRVFGVDIFQPMVPPPRYISGPGWRRSCHLRIRKKPTFLDKSSDLS